MNRQALTLILLAALLVGCADTTPVDLAATADALTLGQAQLSIVRRHQTATAQAIAAQATTEAKATRRAIDAANASATSEAKQTAAALAQQTATSQAYSFNLTATSDALAWAERRAQATATADGQALLAAQERQAASATAATRALVVAKEEAQATSTAVAVLNANIQAEQDAQQARQVSAIMAWIMPSGMSLVTMAAVGLLYSLASQWIGAHRERWRLENQRVALMGMLLETRTGTVAFVGDPHAGYTPRLIGATADLPGDEFEASQIPAAEAVETIQVNGPGGTQFILRSDPQDARAEADRRLVMRLLRDSIRLSGGRADRVPTAKALGWQPALWCKAVALLKPHVEARQGRNGGTFLSTPFATLQQLYADVGARHTPLSDGRPPASAQTLQRTKGIVS